MKLESMVEAGKNMSELNQSDYRYSFEYESRRKQKYPSGMAFSENCIFAKFPVTYDITELTIDFEPFSKKNSRKEVSGVILYYVNTLDMDLNEIKNNRKQWIKIKSLTKEDKSKEF